VDVFTLIENLLIVFNIRQDGHISKEEHILADI
jgi:hypothetical protein